MNRANTQAAKVALVTGAARRVGAAIVKTLHQAGFQVVIHCYQSRAEADLLAYYCNQQYADSVYVLQQELLAPGAVDTLIAAVIAWQGRLDLLVNNAALFIRTESTTFDAASWENLFAVNVKVPFLLSLAARPYLARQEGVIINLTDIHAEMPLKNYAVYCQSKAALVMQTKALACEFAPRVRVNAVAPGAVAWPENDNALSPAIQKKIIAKTPLQQHGSPEYIAQAVLALVNNPFITGQIVHVDGGRSIRGV